MLNVTATYQFSTGRIVSQDTDKATVKCSKCRKAWTVTVDRDGVPYTQAWDVCAKCQRKGLKKGRVK